MRKYKALSFRQLYNTIMQNNFDDYKYEDRISLSMVQNDCKQETKYEKVSWMKREYAIEKKYEALSRREHSSVKISNKKFLNDINYFYEGRMNIPRLSSGFDHIQIKESDVV